jgi:sulfatase modifying factor 1
MDVSAGAGVVLIPPGQVILSDWQTQRSWLVEVAPYELTAFPVTRALYAELIGRWPGSCCRSNHSARLALLIFDWS